MDIDWSTFNKSAEQNCQCGCGSIFRSHAKFVSKLGKVVSRKPCPECGKNDDLRQTTIDWDSSTIKGQSDVDC